MKILGAAMVTVILTFFANTAGAAEIVYGRKDEAWVHIEIVGMIEKGDFNKFQAALIGALPTDNREEWPLVLVYLFSTGGDLVEATRIGALVRELYIPTRAPGTVECHVIQSKNDLQQYGWWPDSVNRKTACACYSACFVIWSAGMDRSGGDNWLRVENGLEIVPRTETFVGVHRPRFDSSYFSELSANEAESVYDELSENLVEFLNRMDTPEPIIERMLITPSSEMHLLSRGELESMYGYPAGADEWLESKCIQLRLTNDEAVDLASLTSKIPDNSFSRPEKSYFDLLYDKFDKYESCRLSAAQKEQSERLATMFGLSIRR